MGHHARFPGPVERSIHAPIPQKCRFSRVVYPLTKEKPFKRIRGLGGGRRGFDGGAGASNGRCADPRSRPDGHAHAGWDGAETTKRILKAHPSTIVIGLSIQTDPHVAESMLNAGAAAFLQKETIGRELYSTIQTALHGRTSAK